MSKKQLIGIGVFVLLIAAIVGIKFLADNGISEEKIRGLTTVYVATGGGKEDFLADPDVLRILKKKYKVNVVFDSWSNGKTVLLPLIRESVGLGNQNVANAISNGDSSYSIHSNGVSKYDALFTSDQRFYDYYSYYGSNSFSNNFEN